MGSGRVWQQTQDGMSGDGFARPAFTHQGQGFTFVHVQGNVSHRMGYPAAALEIHGKVFDTDKRLGHDGAPSVFSASRGSGFCKSGSSKTGSATLSPWIEGITGRLPHKNEQGQHDRQNHKSRNTDPGRLDIVFALGDQFA